MLTAAHVFIVLKHSPTSSIVMAFIILISNTWGIYFKEWRGVDRKTRAVIRIGLLIILSLILIIGYGSKIG